MRMRFIVISLALALGACTPMQWTRENISSDELRRDQAECQQAAQREASARYWFYRPVEPVFVHGPGGAMVWPGGSVVDPYGYQMLEESRLADFCMESKGYKLVPSAKK
jgi:hypothetical protein